VVRPLECAAADTVDAVAGRPPAAPGLPRQPGPTRNFGLTGDNAGAIPGSAARWTACRWPSACAGRLRALTIWQVADRLDRVAGRARLAAGRQPAPVPLRRPGLEHELLGTPSGTRSRGCRCFSAGSASRAEAWCPARARRRLRAGRAGEPGRALLVIAETDGVRPSELRYRMLEALRQYAAERLAEGPDERALRVPARHVLLLTGRAGRAGTARLGTGSVDRRLQQEYPNLRGATMWTHANGEHELSLRSSAPWVVLGRRGRRIFAGEGIICVRPLQGRLRCWAVPAAEGASARASRRRASWLAGDIAESRAYFARPSSWPQERDDRRSRSRS